MKYLILPLFLLTLLTAQDRIIAQLNDELAIHCEESNATVIIHVDNSQYSVNGTIYHTLSSAIDAACGK